MAYPQSYMDSDEYRLPQGMKRVGYDADKEAYTFLYGNQLWIGEPRDYYGGKMKFLRHVDPNERITPLSSPTRQIVSIEPPVKAQNDWGIQTTSISATDAPPPDLPESTMVKRSNTMFKKAANAIRASRKWSSVRKQGEETDSVAEKRSMGEETLTGSFEEKKY